MTEADPFATATDTYSIVVAGNMNPAIHHPAWYKTIEALSEKELQSTNAVIPEGSAPMAQSPSRATICTPAVSQFTAGRIRVTCISQNWTIATTDRDLWIRIRDVAISVFEALGHTPVSAYGLNFMFHRTTSVGNVAARLAQFIDNTPLAFPRDTEVSRSAKIGYTLARPDRSLNLSVEASARSANIIFISINAHHPIILRDTGLHQFDLGVLLRESADKDFEEAGNVLSRVMHSFEGSSD
jgi:hypothetical protein